jgi:predicted dehydrogenase
MSEVLRVGVIGLGFMGRTHLRAWREQGESVRLVAVADGRAEALQGRPSGGGNLGPEDEGPLFDPDEVRGYSQASQLVADPNVDAVSLCTPTDTHVELARNALEHGKHVLIEKPVALQPEPIEELAQAAERSGRVAMPAHCIRFWPAYSWLLEAIRGGRFGAVRSARFTRVGAPPAWSTAFYADAERSGGALFDLHVHDADFVLAAFGLPSRVLARGHRNHVTATYWPAEARSPGEPALSAEGGWVPGAAFSMRYHVTFERGWADFDFNRPEPLLLSEEGGEARPVELDAREGYYHEIAAFREAIRRGTPPPVTLADAAAGTRLLAAEVRSLRSGTVEAVAG